MISRRFCKTRPPRLTVPVDIEDTSVKRALDDVRDKLGRAVTIQDDSGRDTAIRLNRDFGTIEYYDGVLKEWKPITVTNWEYQTKTVDGDTVSIDTVQSHTHSHSELEGFDGTSKYAIEMHHSRLHDLLDETDHVFSNFSSDDLVNAVAESHSRTHNLLSSDDHVLSGYDAYSVLYSNSSGDVSFSDSPEIRKLTLKDNLGSGDSGLSITKSSTQSDDILEVKDSTRDFLSIDKDGLASFNTDELTIGNTGYTVVDVNTINRILYFHGVSGYSVKLGDSSAGYFTDGTKTVTDCGGTFASEHIYSTRIARLGTSSFAGYFEQDNYKTYLSGSTYAGYFTDGTRNVLVSSASQCLSFSNSNFTGFLGSSTLAGYFTDGTRKAYLASGIYAGYFTDGTRIVELCDGSYALDVTGIILLNSNNPIRFRNSDYSIYSSASGYLNIDVLNTSPRKLVVNCNTLNNYGVLTFGSAEDTNLYRYSANLLYTDDDFRANTLCTRTDYKWGLAGYVSGAPTATGYVGITINGTTYKLLAST